MRAETQSPVRTPLRSASFRSIARRVAIAVLAAAASSCALRGAYFDPALAPTTDASRVLHRLILIGDAGEPKEPEPVLTAARLWAGRQRGRASVVFLGDNAYPRGLIERRRADAEQRLLRQIEALAGSDANVAFIPGNHDWDKSDPGGLDAVVAQARFVESHGVDFAPEAGCPGPEILDLPKDGGPAVVRTIAIDTQWWLHRHARGANCAQDTPDEVVAALGKALETPLPVVVMGHHPLATNGPHGGFYDWRAHLFPLGELWSWGRAIPLPLIGSIYPAIRSLAPSRQDLDSRSNRAMRLALERVLASATMPALKIFVAGHEHSLQVLTSTAVDYALVSGAGSSRHETPVTKRYNTLYASSLAGFMVLDVVEDGVRLAIVDAMALADVPTPVFRLTRRTP
jgi:hypothetical protein